MQRLYICSVLVHSLSELYTQNPKCRPWTYIPGGYIWREILFSLQGAYIQKAYAEEFMLCHNSLANG